VYLLIYAGMLTIYIRMSMSGIFISDINRRLILRVAEKAGLGFSGRARTLQALPEMELYMC
jgi:hypothetical protein